MDQPHAGNLPAQMLRCRYLRRLGASAQFRHDLVRDFEKTAAKRFRYDAEVDASAASWGKESLDPEGLARRPCGTWVLISNNVWNLRATTVETLLEDT
jgi:hypothetical protein